MASPLRTSKNHDNPDPEKFELFFNLSVCSGNVKKKKKVALLGGRKYAKLIGGRQKDKLPKWIKGKLDTLFCMFSIVNLKKPKTSNVHHNARSGSLHDHSTSVDYVELYTS